MKVRARHSFWIRGLGLFVARIITSKFIVSYEKCKLKRPYVVLANHASDFDPFLMARCLGIPFYFVMSDHVSSLPVAGKIVKYLLEPIPITKSSKLDTSALRGINDAISGKGNVCIFPEGNKSCAGKNSYISPTISKLAKRLNVPIVIYNIEGAYFANPRWAVHKKRRGRIDVKIKKIYTVEELAQMSNEELITSIEENLTVDSYKIQNANPTPYKGKLLAEGFEHCFYMCPSCKNVSTLRSKNNSIKCVQCGETWTYTEYGYLEGNHFTQTDQWDEWQKEQVKAIDFDSYGENDVLLEDGTWKILRKTTSYRNELLGDFKCQLYKNRLELEPVNDNFLDKIEIPFDRIRGMAFEGRNAFQITTLSPAITYRIKNNTRLSALKYMNYIWAAQKTDMQF